MAKKKKVSDEIEAILKDCQKKPLKVINYLTRLLESMGTFMQELGVFEEWKSKFGKEIEYQEVNEGVKN